MTTWPVGYTMQLMRSVVLCLLALVMVAGCKSRRRYDGTCKVDGDCLDIQKCVSNICVRKEPLFAPYKPKPADEPIRTPRKIKKYAPLPNAPTPELAPGKKAVPAPPRPNLGPAVPRQRDPAKSGRFRLDA